MERLSIESFFTSETDLETNQYRILGGLRKVCNDFDKKKIYPSLAMLIELRQSIYKIKEETNNLSNKFPKQIKGFDVNAQKIIYESAGDVNHNNSVEELFNLIDWALPYIEEAIDEGIILFDFVDENISLDQVGVLPIYKDEGYFMVTDNTAFELQVHRYESTLFSSGNENYRSLKTEFVKSERQVIIRRSPESIKHELIKERKDLPNPATFLFDSELDFPFAETIFPVVKRKLISHIAA
jgi:hypothetical protein